MTCHFDDLWVFGNDEGGFGFTNQGKKGGGVLSGVIKWDPFSGGLQALQNVC